MFDWYYSTITKFWFLHPDAKAGCSLRRDIIIVESSVGPFVVVVVVQARAVSANLDLNYGHELGNDR